jgi:pyrroline-5-carboxylate reductase
MKIAVLGTGNMAGALVRGWVKTLPPENIVLWNRTPERAVLLSEATGAIAAISPTDAVKNADVLLLAAKPWAIVETLESVKNALAPSCLVVSVAAGVSVAAIEGATNSPVIRVMPNTPALVGAGASAFCRGKVATERHAQIAHQLFSAVGVCVEVTEEQLHAVIGVSGSSPAYIYIVIEALTDGGVRMGLPRDVARTLAAQSVLGAAKMVIETKEHPMALKDAVTTPGGTTIAAIEVLETEAVRATFIKAVRAAAERSKEMSQRSKEMSQRSKEIAK